MSSPPVSPYAADSPRRVERIWYQDYSSWQLRGIAAAVGVAVFAAAFVGEWFAVEAGWSAFWLMIASDGMAAIVGALFVLKLMRYSQRHRLATLRRLEVIGEMNHHIRNSLHLIEMSAHITHNREAIDNISAAAERIEWTLREILPRAEEPEDQQPQRRVSPGHPKPGAA